MKRLLTLALVLLTGCAHVAVSRYTQQAFKPTTELEVFHFQMPSRPFTEIAKLTIAQSDSSEQKVIERAKLLGADAVIFVASNSGRTAVVPMGGMYIGRTLADTTAIAVRWK